MPPRQQVATSSPGRAETGEREVRPRPAPAEARPPLPDQAMVGLLGEQQRQPGRTGRAAGARRPHPTRDEASAVLYAIAYVLQNKGHHPPQYQTVPNQYWGLLREWHIFTRGHLPVEMGPGLPRADVSYRGSMLLDHVQSAMAATAPLVQLLRADGDHIDVWLDEEYYRPIDDIRVRGHREQADDQVTAAAEGVSTMPERADKEPSDDELREVLLLANITFTRVAAWWGRKADVTARINAEVAASLKQHGLPPGLERMAGRSALEVVLGLGDITSGLAAILAIQDLQERRKAFNGTFGSVTVGPDVALLSAHVGYLVQGVAALGGYLSAAACIATGHVAEAARALAAVGPVTAYRGAVGRAIGVFQIVAGTMALIDPDSTAADRTYGAVRIAWGTPYLVGGAAGFALSSAVFAVQLDLAVLEHATGATRGLVWADLGKCYQRMRSTARGIIEYGNRVIAGRALAEAESDPTRRAYLLDQLQTDALMLYQHLAYFMGPSDRIDHPGKWKPLRERFDKATPWPPRNPTPDLILAQARAVLDTIEHAFADREAILDAATLER